MAVLTPRHLRNDRGMASVEMAVVALILMMLTFGGMEYGWMFYRMQEISNVSREAARTAVLPTSTGTTVTDRVNLLMTNYGMDGSGYTVTLNPSDITTAPVQSPVKVTIAVPYANIGLTGISLFPAPTNLTAVAFMAKEGP